MKTGAGEIVFSTGKHFKSVSTVVGEKFWVCH
jgi:hypothetical protein